MSRRAERRNSGRGNGTWQDGRAYQPSVPLSKTKSLQGSVPRKLHDDYTGTDVFASPATLIVTPSGILGQWISELKAHASSLRILHYEGINGSAGKRPLLTDDELRETLLDQDVVLTTYNVLSREVRYTQEIPDRAFRNRNQTQPRRSPLMQISW